MRSFENPSFAVSRAGGIKYLGKDTFRCGRCRRFNEKGWKECYFGTHHPLNSPCSSYEDEFPPPPPPGIQGKKSQRSI